MTEAPKARKAPRPPYQERRPVDDTDRAIQEAVATIMRCRHYFDADDYYGVIMKAVYRAVTAERSKHRSHTALMRARMLWVFLVRIQKERQGHG